MLLLFIYIHTEEGAGGEAGRRGDGIIIHIYTGEGIGREPVGGGRRKISYPIVILVYTHMNNV